MTTAEVLAPLAEACLTRLTQASPLLVAVEPGFPSGLLAASCFGGSRYVWASRPSVADARRTVENARRVGPPVLALEVTGMSVPAQHALLKLIEEPPPSTSVVLFHEASWLPLETILSRCFPWPLTPLDAAEKVTLLAELEGVSPDLVERAHLDYSQTLAELRLALGVERGPVDELLAGLAVRDVVRCMSAARGFDRPQARMLHRIIRTHITGNQHPALASLRLTTLETWARLLDTLSPSFAVRWGVFEALGG